MELDPKCFFENPPRMKEDVKDYMKLLAKLMVTKLKKFHMTLFGSERLNSKHVKLIVLAMCPDPITTYNRQGLCNETSKLKPICKVLCKDVDTAMLEFTNGDKLGGTDKKIFKGCKKILEDVPCSQNGIVAVSSIVSTICGILLQSSIENCKDIKTLTLEMVKTEGVNHKASNGVTYPYNSLMRFLSIVESFEPLSIPETTKMKKNDAKHLDTPKKAKHLKVSFTNENAMKQNPRPSTPENCFWDD